MARPGTVVQLLETPGTVSVPTDTGTWFAAGVTERGPVVPELVYSLNDFMTKFGNRMSYSILYDCIEDYFREGGNKVYIGRVCGPGATLGTLALKDSGAVNSLIVNANGPGAWSANFKIAVYASTPGYGIQVLDVNNNVLEDSGVLVDQASAVQWALSSNYVTIALGTSTNLPAVAAATAMSAGNDDRSNIADANWQAALDAFSVDFGPGQVSAPGQTSASRHSALVNHAVTRNRVALLDLVDSATPATLTGNLPAYSQSSRFAAAFAPWLIIPGVTPNSTRTIPPSPMIAGMIAANDPALGVDAASAGQNGISNYTIDLTQNSWDDPTRQSLNQAGVDVIRQIGSTVKNYGWRSLANPVSDVNWLDFGNARLFMALSAELGAIGENFMFENIDGQNGVTVNAFHNALSGAMLVHWNNGDLFGDTPDASFLVDTGPGVNTLQTIANLELHAVVQVRMSPFAEWIQIQVVKRQTSDVIVASA